MHVVPAVSTPISAEHARDALAAAMPGIDRDSASLLLGLVWVETGGGHLVSNNAGNITANDKWPGGAWRPPWFAPSDDPHLQALHDRMLAGQAPSAFRAYDSAPDGFKDFARVLKSQFRPVLEAARTGSPGLFVQGLHDSGYSKDYTLAHVPSFTHFREQFLPLLARFPAGSALSVGLGSGAALALLAGLWALGRYRHRKPRHRRAG